MAKYIVKPNQNIFDIALQLYGSVEGVFDLLVTNKQLTMNTDLNTGDELEYHDNFIINQTVVNELKSTGTIPANGERTVYHKHAKEQLLLVCDVDTQFPFVSFVAGGEGVVVIDWGDNSALQSVSLTHEKQTITHYFNSEVDKRRLRFYGNTDSLKFTYLDTTEIHGWLHITYPIVVDEYVSRSNGFSLDGLFLFNGTYKIDLHGCAISNLLPIAKMELQELDLTKVHFSSVSVLDEYLIYIANNYGTRIGCNVTLDTEPSEAGMAAIQKIISEPEWNAGRKWKFTINGRIYTHTN